MRSFLITALSVTTLFVAAPTTAQEYKSRAVHFEDIDLGSAKGQATLQRRIRLAVNRVCNENGDDIRDLIQMQSYQACRKAAFNAATSKVAMAIGQNKMARLDTPEISPSVH